MFIKRYNSTDTGLELRLELTGLFQTSNKNMPGSADSRGTAAHVVAQHTLPLHLSSQTLSTLLTLS